MLALERAGDLAGQPPQETIEGGAGTPLQVEEDLDVVVGQEIGDLFEDGGFADAALAMQHQDVVNEFPRQASLNPAKDILAAEEHAGFDNGCSSDIGIENVIHFVTPSPQGNNN